MLLAGQHRPILRKFSKNKTSSDGRIFRILSKSLSLSPDITTGLFNNVTLGKDLFDVPCPCITQNRNILKRATFVERQQKIYMKGQMLTNLKTI